MKSKKKFKAIMGVSLAVMLAVPVSVFGVSGVFGGTPKTQQTQTTASPLGLNPETDPVIMTTDYGLEIKLGGALTNTSLSGYAYITTKGDINNDGVKEDYNWVIIGYNNVTSNTSGITITGNTIPEIVASINTFDKYATIEGLEGATRQTPQTQTEGLGDSPFSGIIDDQAILNEIGNNDITYYKIDYTKQVVTYNFPNAVDTSTITGNTDLDDGEVLCLSENILFNEYFKTTDYSANKYSAKDYMLYEAMNSIAEGKRTADYKTETSNYKDGCDFGLSSLGLYNESTNPNGKIMPQTLYTNYSIFIPPVHVLSNTLENQYVFPLAQSKYGGTSSPNVTQNFIVETYLNTDRLRIAYYNGSASYWSLRSGCRLDYLSECVIHRDGRLHYLAVDAYGVRPAFVLNLG